MMPASNPGGQLGPCGALKSPSSSRWSYVPIITVKILAKRFSYARRHSEYFIYMNSPAPLRYRHGICSGPGPERRAPDHLQASTCVYLAGASRALFPRRGSL